MGEVQESATEKDMGVIRPAEFVTAHPLGFCLLSLFKPARVSVDSRVLDHELCWKPLVLP